MTGSTQCGARVDLNSPYAAAPGSVRVGFALSETLPVLSVVQVFLPDVASPFIFSSGGASQAEGLVTAAGDEQVAPMHGMGAPTLSVERVASGTLATVILGEIRQPTLADSPARPASKVDSCSASASKTCGAKRSKSGGSRVVEHI